MLAVWEQDGYCAYANHNRKATQHIKNGPQWRCATLGLASRNRK
jgi:hypothetical protein